jgi:hypothetical protein
MENSSAGSDPRPLVASRDLEHATFGGRYLFRGKGVEAYLEPQLKDLVESVCMAPVSGVPQRSVEALLEEVLSRWGVEPLKLSSRVSQDWVRPHELSYHKEKVRDPRSHILATIYIGYAGEDDWWDVKPKGTERLNFKAALVYSRLELTVRVPAGEAEHAYDLLKESGSWHVALSTSRRRSWRCSTRRSPIAPQP